MVKLRRLAPVVAAAGGLAVAPAIGHALDLPPAPTVPGLPGLPTVPTPTVPLPVEPPAVMPVPTAPTAEPGSAPSSAPTPPAESKGAAPTGSSPRAVSPSSSKPRSTKRKAARQAVGIVQRRRADVTTGSPALDESRRFRATPASDPPSPHPRRGVLGLTVSDVAQSIAELHPAFFVLLGLAVALLGIASVPATRIPHPAAAAAVAHRRIEVTLAGVLALAVVVGAYLLVLT